MCCLCRSLFHFLSLSPCLFALILSSLSVSFPLTRSCQYVNMLRSHQHHRLNSYDTVFPSGASAAQGNFQQITRFYIKYKKLNVSERFCVCLKDTNIMFITVQAGLSCCLNVVKRLLFLVFCCCELNTTAVMQLH